MGRPMFRASVQEGVALGQADYRAGSSGGVARPAQVQLTVPAAGDVRPFSERQREAFLHGCNPTGHRLFIAGGSTRGGKTFSCCMGFAYFVNAVVQREPDAPFMIGSFTQETAIRNVVGTVIRGLRSCGLDAKIASEGSHTVVRVSSASRARIFLYGLGARNEEAVERLRGAEFRGGLIDEVTQASLEAWNMLGSRFDQPGCRVWCTYNANQPGHWFRVEVLRELDKWGARLVEFELEDNPSMSAEMRDVFARQFTGAFGKRMLAGEWAPMQGRVYPFWKDRIDARIEVDEVVPVADGKQPERVYERVFGLDHGLSSTMAVVGARAARVGMDGPVSRTTWLLDREYYYDAEREGVVRTEDDHLRAMKEVVPEGSILIIDPSTPSEFVLKVRDAGWDVIPGDNREVYERVGLIGGLLAGGWVVVDRDCCPNLVDELMSYEWMTVSGANDRAVDTPRKKFDHGCDAMRYLVNWLVDVEPVRFGGPGMSEYMAWGGRKRPLRIQGPTLGTLQRDRWLEQEEAYRAGLER